MATTTSHDVVFPEDTFLEDGSEGPPTISTGRWSVNHTSDVACWVVNGKARLHISRAEFAAMRDAAAGIRDV